MLTEKERNGLKDILDSLNEEELFRLLETVTKRNFVTRNRSEAIETILTCTDKPSDLLQRQKITKKIILNYLISKKQSALPEWGKITLVQKCLEIWQSTESIKESDYTEVKETISTEVSQPATSQMGIEFSKWFFSILNTLKDFGPQHFWPSCILSAEYWSPSEQKDISLNGALDVASFLANLITHDNYQFSVNNSSDSVKVEMESHGLVKIIVHGVLHQHSNCVGLFDFAFGLVRNPDAEYNYKIQVIKLKMQVNCGSQGDLTSSNQLAICQSAY